MSVDNTSGENTSEHQTLGFHNDVRVCKVTGSVFADHLELLMDPNNLISYSRDNGHWQRIG